MGSGAALVTKLDMSAPCPPHVLRDGGNGASELASGPEPREALHRRARPWPGADRRPPGSSGIGLRGVHEAQAGVWQGGVAQARRLARVMEKGGTGHGNCGELGHGGGGGA